MTPRRVHRLPLLLLVLPALVVLLGGCGQKGPLYLPDSDPPAQRSEG